MKEAESILFMVTTPLYALVILAELLFSNWQGRRLYTWRDFAANLYLMLLNAGLDLLLRGGVFVLLSFFAQYRLFEWGNTWAYWLALFVAEDFAFYWLHRFDHSCRLFWAVHVTHHSSEHFNLTTGFRSSVFQPAYRFLYFIPLVLLGFHVLDIFFMYSLTQIYGILVHTQTVRKLGLLEYVLVTPSHHRVHHASNVRYLDKNLGMVLIVWDRLFGTFTPENPSDPPQYGLFGKKAPSDWIGLVFHEWRDIIKDVKNAPTWRNKLAYLFQPPGWSHDGRSMTSRELRARRADKP
jgi:sterol desaturase/sphingolipid hydroxylase (fatty acid hydroxylase superfamily)